jgi:hypothetical protein
MNIYLVIFLSNIVYNREMLCHYERSENQMELKLYRIHQLLAYADDRGLLASNISTINENEESVLVACSI